MKGFVVITVPDHSFGNSNGSRGSKARVLVHKDSIEAIVEDGRSGFTKAVTIILKGSHPIATDMTLEEAYRLIYIAPGQEHKDFENFVDEAETIKIVADAVKDA